MVQLWGRVKIFLKRFWPVTIYRFNQDIQTISGEVRTVVRQQMHGLEVAQDRAVKTLCQRLSDICSSWEVKLDKSEQNLRSDIANQQSAMQETTTAIKEEQAFLKKEIRDLKKTIQEESKIFYYCPHEVKSIENHGFYEARQTAHYLEDYQRLVCGLDVQSIEIINTVLSRHLLVRGKNETRIDLFSQIEQDIIARQRKEFYASVVPITPEVVACGKYLLAVPKGGMGFTETTIFTDRMGFDKLEHPERVRDKHVLDLGAFVGDSSLILSELTSQNVYAFEPGRANFTALKKTIELNRCRRIIPIRMAVGAECGEVLVPTRLSMGIEVEQITEETSALPAREAVPVTSVDEYVAQHNLRVGLIKVDIEGYEQDFLKGAERTIREQRPALLLSMYHNASDFFGLKPILESWNIGYHFKVHKEINEHIHYDIMLIAETD